VKCTSSEVRLYVVMFINIFCRGVNVAHPGRQCRGWYNARLRLHPLPSRNHCHSAIGPSNDTRGSSHRDARAARRDMQRRTAMGRCSLSERRGY